MPSCSEPAANSLAEGEYVTLDAGLEEGDLQGAFRDRSRLPDQLIQPLVHHRAVARFVLRGEAGIGKTALLGYLWDRVAGWRIATIVGLQTAGPAPQARLWLPPRSAITTDTYEVWEKT